MTEAPPSHIPVLLTPILSASAPICGHWIDGTLGAGGYTRALLDAGAEHVTAIDCDPYAHELAKAWAQDYQPCLTLIEGNFSDMEGAVGGLKVDGVVLDLGVSSMQLDTSARGFSFMRDGPLDMRMGQSGPSAAELVNMGHEAELADILFQYGEERASRRIARAIVAARPFARTKELADCISACLPKKRPGQAHPATRSFQAFRIAVNDELGALIGGLEAAERILKPGGILAVVSFHSLEDRIVKRFLSARAGSKQSNRHQPETETQAHPPRFELINRKAVESDSTELAANLRARSARLRMARRSVAPALSTPRTNLGLPGLVGGRA